MDFKKIAEQLKTEFKENYKILVGAAGTVAAATIFFRFKTTLDLTRSDRKLLKSGDGHVRYSVGGHDYILTYAGKTPKQ